VTPTESRKQILFSATKRHWTMKANRANMHVLHCGRSKPFQNITRLEWRSQLRCVNWKERNAKLLQLFVL